MEANRIGFPVTALTDSAAPPRASPSSLLITTPSNCTASAKLLGDVDGVLTGHRVDDEQDVVRADGLADVHELGHQLLVDVQATARVDDQHVLALLPGLLERPGGDLDRIAVGAALIHGRAGLGADLHELLDGGRAVDVAGGERDRARRARSCR